MINFDEEIKKFHPSLEIDDVEQVAKEENAVQDLTDLMLEVMNESKRIQPAVYMPDPEDMSN